MTSRPTYAVLVLAVFLSPGIGQAGLFGPSNYDECITDSMKGVSSDVAARAILSSCRNRFPAETVVTPQLEEAAAEQQEVAREQQDAVPEQQDAVPEQQEIPPERQKTTSESSRSLTADELRKLATTAFIFANTYRLTFQNRNEHLTITEVTIAVGDETIPDGFREYSQNVRIAPLASGSVRYSVVYEGDEANWAWHVASAKGIE